MNKSELKKWLLAHPYEEVVLDEPENGAMLAQRVLKLQSEGAQSTEVIKDLLDFANSREELEQARQIFVNRLQRHSDDFTASACLQHCNSALGQMGFHENRFGAGATGSALTLSGMRGASGIRRTPRLRKTGRGKPPKHGSADSR